MQIWYVVAKHCAESYQKILSQSQRHAVASKSLYPNQPSDQEIERGWITRIVQQPGELVITEPVSCLRKLLFVFEESAACSLCLLLFSCLITCRACSIERLPEL